MLTRLVAALVGLAILVPAVVWGGVVAVDVIVPLAALICCDEYARMAFPEDRPAHFVALLVGCALVYGTGVYLGDRWVGIAAALAVVGTLAFVTFRPDPLDHAADRAGRLLVGIGWLGGCFAFMPLLRRLDDGLALVFLLLAIAWLGDTGGYFAGRFFGRHKLYEKISPKKTWEGLFGGIILTIAGVFAMRAVALPGLSPLDCVLIGGGLGISATVGDLSESMLKRAFHVKDSGWIMPGHGGLLDRVDSVLFVAPLLYGYAVLVLGY